VEAALRAAARDLILAGEVDPTAVSLEELRALAKADLAESLENDDLQFEMVVDYTDSTLHEARTFVDNGRYEFGFVFYGLHIEHLLNRAIRDRSKQLALSESETVELMKRSLYDKTGLTWKLLFGSDMPLEIAQEIRDTAQRRNQFAHYKWQPNPDQHMPHDLRKSEIERATQAAERGAAQLKEYVDSLVADAATEIHDWINGPRLPRSSTGDLDA